MEMGLPLPVVIVVLQHTGPNRIEKEFNPPVLRVGRKGGGMVGIDGLILATHVSKAGKATGLAAIAQVVADYGLLILESVGGPGRNAMDEEIDSGLPRGFEVGKTPLKSVEVHLLHGCEQIVVTNPWTDPAGSQEGNNGGHPEGPGQDLLHHRFIRAYPEHLTRPLLGINLQPFNPAVHISELHPQTCFTVNPGHYIPINRPPGQDARALTGGHQQHRLQRILETVNGIALRGQVGKGSAPEPRETSFPLPHLKNWPGLGERCRDGRFTLLLRPRNQLPLRNFPGRFTRWLERMRTPSADRTEIASQDQGARDRGRFLTAAQVDAAPVPELVPDVHLPTDGTIDVHLSNPTKDFIQLLDLGDLPQQVHLQVKCRGGSGIPEFQPFSRFHPIAQDHQGVIIVPGPQPLVVLQGLVLPLSFQVHHEANRFRGAQLQVKHIAIGIYKKRKDRLLGLSQAPDSDLAELETQGLMKRWFCGVKPLLQPKPHPSHRGNPTVDFPGTQTDVNDSLPVRPDMGQQGAVPNRHGSLRIPSRRLPYDMSIRDRIRRPFHPGGLGRGESCQGCITQLLIQDQDLSRPGIRSPV